MFLERIRGVSRNVLQSNQKRYVSSTSGVLWRFVGEDEKCGMFRYVTSMYLLKLLCVIAREVNFLRPVTVAVRPKAWIVFSRSEHCCRRFESHSMPGCFCGGRGAAALHQVESPVQGGLLTLYKTKKQLRSRSPQANYTDRGTASCRRS
jgi:hypothetical protein